MGQSDGKSHDSFGRVSTGSLATCQGRVQDNVHSAASVCSSAAEAWTSCVEGPLVAGVLPFSTHKKDMLAARDGKGRGSTFKQLLSLFSKLTNLWREKARLRLGPLSQEGYRGTGSSVRRR